MKQPCSRKIGARYSGELAFYVYVPLILHFMQLEHCGTLGVVESDKMPAVRSQSVITKRSVRLSGG